MRGNDPNAAGSQETPSCGATSEGTASRTQLSYAAPPPPMTLQDLLMRGAGLVEPGVPPAAERSRSSNDHTTTTPSASIPEGLLPTPAELEQLHQVFASGPPPETAVQTASSTAPESKIDEESKVGEDADRTGEEEEVPPRLPPQ
jgi:hypothetical protein